MERTLPSDGFGLRGKTALVTGSARGLGHAIARGLTEAGASVFINGTRADTCEAAAAQFRADGFEAFPLPFDVADGEAVRSQVAAALRQAGRLDIVVNNAGVNIRGPLVDYPEESWDRVLDIHLRGAFLVGREAAKGMIERRSGKVINICSLGSEITRPTVAAYAAAKGGLKMLTRAMAVEWGPHNVQANGIAPGYFATDMNKPLMADPEFSAWVIRRTPAGRWGEPRELVGAALFLASPLSDYVNGHMLAVDGGFLASM